VNFSWLARVESGAEPPTRGPFGRVLPG
jgi:hypothetical protein